MVPNMINDRTFLRLALTAALIASLGLAACGRKGPLDPPPGASAANDTRANDTRANEPASPGALMSPIGGETRNNNTGIGPDGRMQAPPGEKKRIFLDGLLD